MLRLAGVLAVLLVPAFLPPWSAAEAPVSRPIHIQADQLTYHKATQTYEGKGSVVVVQGTLRLEADEATLNVATGQVRAVGHMRLNDGFRDIHGERMDFNMNTSTGVIFHGRLFVVDGGFTVDAQVVERLSEEHYRMEAASYTTCSLLDGETAPWRFKSATADLDVDGYLYARNAQFCILDVPVFYSPVVVWPAQRERATGFLMPVVGSSSSQGFKLREAFYWNINPSQDATITLDERGKLGTGVNLEYRYKLSRGSDGHFWVQYFRDVPDSLSRWNVLYTHKTIFSDDLQARINVNYLNQRSNLFTLSEDVTQRVKVYQESSTWLSKRWEDQVLYGLGRFSQNLTTLSDKTVIQTLPELGYSLVPARLWNGIPLYGGMDVTFDSFYRQVGVDARRGDLFPRLWAPIPLDRYLTITPLFGVRETWYSRSIQSADPITREAAYFSTTADTRLVRRFTTEEGRAISHKIEPAVTYEYLAPSRQTNVLVFNDVDRLFPKNLLTYTLTSRLSTMVPVGDTARYLEFAYLRLTQSEQVGSPNRLPSSNSGGTVNNQTLGVHPPGRPFSDLRAELILRTFTPLPVTLRMDTFYDYTESAVAIINTDLQFTLTNEYFFTLGQRFTRAGPVPVRGDLFNPATMNDVLVQTENTHFFTAEVGKTLPFNLYAVVRGYYDAHAGIFPEVDYGLYYVNPSRCWGVGAMILQRGQIPGVAPSSVEFAFAITLGGVGYTETPLSALYEGLFNRLGLDIQKLRTIGPPASSTRPY